MEVKTKGRMQFYKSMGEFLEPADIVLMVWRSNRQGEKSDTTEKQTDTGRGNPGKPE